MTQRDGQDSMDSKVRGWLETSGRALELRVARTLNRAGAEVKPSFSYGDSTTGTWRESDVLARFRWLGRRNIPCSITMVVECKSSTKHPWVAFYDHRLARFSSLEHVFSFAAASHSDVLPPLVSVWEGHAPFDENQVATHAVAAFAGDKGNQAASNDPVHDAMRQVLSAAEAVREDYIRNQVRVQAGLAVLPVIVVEAPIMKCSLSSDGEIDLIEADLVHVWSRSQPAKRVYVLRERALPRFAEAVAGRVHDAGANS